MRVFSEERGIPQVPGTFVFLGVENKGKGILYPQHHPKFDMDEDILPIGTTLHVGVALEYLKGDSGSIRKNST